MDTGKAKTWLEVLEGRTREVNSDIDWMDPDYIKSMPFKPHDQTSNQVWLGMQLSHIANEESIIKSGEELQAASWLAVYSRMAALMCKKNLDFIQGRLLVQTSPSQAYDTKAILEHARLYDQEFQRVGIPRSRFCIKILATGPGVVAAKVLESEGIRTLGTGVFSVEQAIACSQAGCLYISPYYNEVRTHQDPSLWPNVEDPATQHPFSNRILQMYAFFMHRYKTTGQEQPFIKNAAFRSIKEVIATAELGCHSATISPKMLDELAATTYDKTINLGVEVLKQDHPYRDAGPVPQRLRQLLHSDPLSPGQFKPADTNVDYLVDGGSNLEKALAGDSAGSNRLKDATALFVRAEDASRKLIETKTGRSIL